MTDKLLKVSSVLILIYFNLVFTLKDETPIRGEFYIAKLRLLSLRCKVHQPEIAKINYCHLRSYSRNFQTLNINADLLKDLYNPVDVSIAVYYKFLTIFREVYRIKFNYCSLWIGNTTEFSSKNPLIDFIYKLVEESIPSAVKHGCPFKKGKYIWENTSFSLGKIPMNMLIPTGEYKVLGNLTMNGKLTETIWGTGEVNTPLRDYS